MRIIRVTASNRIQFAAFHSHSTIGGIRQLLRKQDTYRKRKTTNQHARKSQKHPNARCSAHSKHLHSIRPHLARLLHPYSKGIIFEENMMSRGSAGNVIAALCSFFIPGLGQLLQGRWFLAGFMFVMSVVLWVILLGWIIHLWSIIDAALYDPPERYRAYRHRRRYDW